MALRHLTTMAEHNENGSATISSISDAQASILDLMLFPGFTRMSTVLREHLNIDVNLYIPLLCFLGLLAFFFKRTYECLIGWLDIHCTSTVHLRYREDAYDMFMLWTSSQEFSQKARSSLVTTSLVSSLNHSRVNRFEDEDTSAKTLYYTPWNGQFFIWYKGRLIVFRRKHRPSDFCEREDVSISCFGRSPQPLKELLSDCRTEYTRLVRGKTCLYEHQNNTWVRSPMAEKRPISTVILSDSQKQDLLKDVEDFLDRESQKWYSNRGIPYRRGYLLYGPPGTGKSSLSMSIGGHFGLDIYILSLSAVTEANLNSLFANLPSRCIILLEDIDAVSSSRSRDSSQIVTGSSSKESELVGGKVSLSALLNVIDGVASQEGRILVMTTNHIDRLDKALIRPGRVDKKVELGLADQKMTAELFCIVFKSVEGDITPGKDTQSDISEAARSRAEEAHRIELLANKFAARVPELKFSPAEILAFLLEHRKSPGEAIDNVEQLVSKSVNVQSERSRISKDAEPGINGASKCDRESLATKVLTEMIETPRALTQPITPPSSPNLSPPKYFHMSDFEVVSSPFIDFQTSENCNQSISANPPAFPENNNVLTHDAQELVKAVMDMQMTSAHASKCTCSHTPPEDPLETTSTDP